MSAESGLRWSRRPENRRKVALATRRRQAPFRFVTDAAKAAPCADCGGRFPGVCMDFDHRPGETKLITIAQIQPRHGAAFLMAEMAKCDVVCANCHRLRTRARFLETEC